MWEEKTEEEEITQKEQETAEGEESKSDKSEGKKKVSEGSSTRHRHLCNCYVWDKKFF